MPYRNIRMTQGVPSKPTPFHYTVCDTSERKNKRGNESQFLFTERAPCKSTAQFASFCTYIQNPDLLHCAFSQDNISSVSIDKNQVQADTSVFPLRVPCTDSMFIIFTSHHIDESVNTESVISWYFLLLCESSFFSSSSHIWSNIS